MAIIDRVLPLTTFVSFVGGNSGQMTIELMRCHHLFSKCDEATTDEKARYNRVVRMPFAESQYIKRLPYGELMDDEIGHFCWIRNDDTKQWIRSQCEDWFMIHWEMNSHVELDQVLSQGQIITVPTHLSPDFIGFAMPESRRIFVVDDNAYFATRADEAKNPDKHPDDRMARFKYLSHRVANHRCWNTMEFNWPNSVTINRSRLFNQDRSVHADEMRKIYSLHGIDAEESLLDITHEMVIRYLHAQVAAGYIKHM